MDFPAERLAQADGHSGLREDDAAPPVEVLCGILILLGAATRYAALLVLVFTIFATFSSHRYWSSPEAQQANQASHFWKNISMMGGQVLLFVTAGGRYSIDALLRRK
jgi:putative oxidoreductase